jgi:aspartate/glutamate racemase
MKDFIDQIKQPYWWLAVVLVGLTLNVVASYIRDWLDRTGRRFGGYISKRVALRDAAIAEEAERVRHGRNERLWYTLRSISERLHAIGVLCLGLFLIVISVV